MLTAALYPEFGTEWAGPDGAIWKAIKEAQLTALREALSAISAAEPNVYDALDHAEYILEALIEKHGGAK